MLVDHADMLSLFFDVVTSLGLGASAWIMNRKGIGKTEVHQEAKYHSFLI